MYAIRSYYEIKKNMMDDYSTVGAILSTRDEYPLWWENVADCAFCVIKTVEFRDLTAHVMSFDVSASGTAEGDSLVWRSRAGNYLVFPFSGETVSKIRWHESREATYKNVRVWETRH